MFITRLYYLAMLEGICRPSLSRLKREYAHKWFHYLLLIRVLPPLLDLS